MIPVFKPKVNYSDIFSVLKTLISENISGTSPVIEIFEKKLAQKFNRKYCVAVSNGSVALDLSLQSLNLKKGDEVIIPSFTIISALSAVLRTEATPVFCDVDPESWNMTLKNVEHCYTQKTRAVLMVHTYGLTAEASKIENFCKDNRIELIEDAAEAHGQEADNRKCGSFGLISTFSFYANKHITTGEGGAVLTDSEEIYNILIRMRNLDFTKKNRFNHENMYWNYRLSGLQAALGISQIDSLETVIKKKIKQGDYYLELLNKYSELIQLPMSKHKNTKNHYWVFGILLKDENKRDRLMELLLEKGIETRPFFWPLHLQTFFIKDAKDTNTELEVSENLGRNGLYLPIGTHINKKIQQKIVGELISSIKEIK